MAILVYVFNRWEYHPVVRSAVLTSVFGYTLAGLAIFLDIGRYWNGYKLFLPWTGQLQLRPGGSGPLHRRLRGGAVD